MSKNPVNHKRTKHIDIRYHFTRERVESGEVELKYIATEHQLADLLTKLFSAIVQPTCEQLACAMLGYKVE